jgi:hypothetical protein
MEFAGSFRQYSFVDVMHSIETNQRTGRLAIANGNLRATIYFASGQWLLAERSGPGQLLAQQLVKAGLVTAEQIETACSVPFAQAGATPDVQLIRTLLSSRLITQDRLQAWAVNDAIALMTVVLGWQNGEFRFEDLAGLPQGRVALPLPASPLLAMALQRVQVPSQPVHTSLPVSPDAIIDFVEVDANSGAAVQITRDQWRVLTAVDGLSSLRTIAQYLRAPEPMVLHLASEMVTSGVVMVVSQHGGSPG